MSIETIVADYHNEKHANDIVFLLNLYAEDAMGGGSPLSDQVKSNLPHELAKLENALSILCYVDREPVGLMNCFVGFSTFKCKPIMYIHDLVVASNTRGLGLSQRMLSKTEEIALQKECCKITLEVLEGNKIAQRAYLKFGFAGYELDPKMGKALFWEKLL